MSAMQAEDRFWARVQKSDGCWTWIGGHNRAGYGRLMVDREVIPAHRFAWTIANGPIPQGMIVCHRCDNPPCVRPDHLFVGTYADNHRDMRAKGRDVGNRRLSPPVARRIRELNASGVPQAAIAAMFAIGQTTVSHVVRGTTWAAAGGPVQSLATHCKNGHPRVVGDGYCHACNAAAVRRYVARRQAAVHGP